MGMDAIEFVLRLEDAFGVTIPDRDAAELETAGQWHTYLVARVPNLNPDDVWKKELDVLCDLLKLDAEQRQRVQPSSHLVRDLSFT
jgi:hypothetical protein